MSLQYSPVFKSHCCALGKQCEKKGYQVKYFFAEQYRWMLTEDVIKKSIFVGSSKDLVSSLFDGLSHHNRRLLAQAFMENRPNYIYMHNIQPLLNLYVAKLAHKYNSIYIQHVHEPYFENKKVHGQFYHQWWWYLFEYFQGHLLKYTDIAVLSSNVALSLFEKRYPHFQGRKIKIPLMYEDFGQNNSTGNNRRYITFIGPPVPSKGPETFSLIADWALKNDINLNLLLISRKAVTDPQLLNKSNIQIFFKEKISDEEIGDFIKNSQMTITPYRTAKQSSVALSSYMYGTPVISTNIGGLPEIIHHLKTGYLLNLNAKVEEWIAGINYIQQNLSILSQECRNYFLANCSESNWPKYFQEIFMR